jgi:hypothetical protein
MRPAVNSQGSAVCRMHALIREGERSRKEAEGMTGLEPLTLQSYEGCTKAARDPPRVPKFISYPLSISGVPHAVVYRTGRNIPWTDESRHGLRAREV